MPRHGGHLFALQPKLIWTADSPKGAVPGFDLTSSKKGSNINYPAGFDLDFEVCTYTHTYNTSRTCDTCTARTHTNAGRSIPVSAGQKRPHESLDVELKVLASPRLAVTHAAHKACSSVREVTSSNELWEMVVIFSWVTRTHQRGLAGGEGSPCPRCGASAIFGG